MPHQNGSFFDVLDHVRLFFILLRHRQNGQRTDQQNRAVVPFDLLLERGHQMNDRLDAGRLGQLLDIVFGKVDGFEIGIEVVGRPCRSLNPCENSNAVAIIHQAARHGKKPNYQSRFD